MLSFSILPHLLCRCFEIHILELPNTQYCNGKINGFYIFSTKSFSGIRLRGRADSVLASVDAQLPFANANNPTLSPLPLFMNRFIVEATSNRTILTNASLIRMFWFSILHKVLRKYSCKPPVWSQQHSLYYTNPLTDLFFFYMFNSSPQDFLTMWQIT